MKRALIIFSASLFSTQAYIESKYYFQSPQIRDAVRNLGGRFETSSIGLLLMGFAILLFIIIVRSKKVESDWKNVFYAIVGLLLVSICFWCGFGLIFWLN